MRCWRRNCSAAEISAGPTARNGLAQHSTDHRGSQRTSAVTEFAM
jgi:hypothetical protein